MPDRKHGWHDRQNLPEALAESGKVTRGWLGVGSQPVTLGARIEALDAKGSAQADPGEKAKPALGLAVQPLTPAALARLLGVRATQVLVVQNVQEGSPAAGASERRRVSCNAP